MEEASSRTLITDILIIGALIASLWLTMDQEASADDGEPALEARPWPARGEPGR
ncbi:MAG: hypothetical protein NUW23_04770 [Firmicutes bacterium]|jgi:hypothetical protein|nr:hypothetical protein [Bacillota bacterium]